MIMVEVHLLQPEICQVEVVIIRMWCLQPHHRRLRPLRLCLRQQQIQQVQVVLLRQWCLQHHHCHHNQQIHKQINHHRSQLELLLTLVDHFCRLGVVLHLILYLRKEVLEFHSVKVTGVYFIFVKFQLDFNKS